MVGACSIMGEVRNVYEVVNIHSNHRILIIYKLY
jgi:hypothetical protein